MISFILSSIVLIAILYKQSKISIEYSEHISSKIFALFVYSIILFSIFLSSFSYVYGEYLFDAWLIWFLPLKQNIINKNLFRIFSLLGVIYYRKLFRGDTENLTYFFVNNFYMYFFMI